MSTTNKTLSEILKEVNKKYGPLPKFRVKDIFQDFIDIEKDRIE